MTEDQNKQKPDEAQPGNIGRRQFVALSVLAGFGAAEATGAAGVEVIERDVEIKTPDGI